MTGTDFCPECGCSVPNDAPGGFCPSCLIRQGLQGFADETPAGTDSNTGSEPATPVSAAGAFIPPSPSELAPLFPQLEILEPLGHGGMGAVYKARQTKLDRLVALKIIRPETAVDPTFAERFMREARTLARLNHAGIVSVHDFGEVELKDARLLEESGLPSDGMLYFFVMEYVDGVNLRQLQDTSRTSPEQALAIIPQICEALQFAHDEGVVHRDIKPENVLIDRQGRVKIADFGLARLIEASAQDFTLTATHQVMGTPQYMSPEQMSGSHGVDHRADIYSLGVVFYELLTGEIPMGQFEPPSRKAAIDVRLDDIVMRALAREPERRFQSAGEMKSGVESISSIDIGTPHEFTRAAAAAPRAGVSTIMEREVAAAWRWVAGESDQTKSRRPELPAMLMFALAVAGCLMILLPWIDIMLPDRIGGPGEHSISTQSFSGSDHESGGIASIVFAFMAVLIIATPLTNRRSVWWASLMSMLSVGAIICVLAFRLETSMIRYGVGVYMSDKWVTQYFRAGDIAELIHCRGFYGALGLSVTLLLLSATGIRHAIAFRKTDDLDLKDTGLQRARIRFPEPVLAGLNSVEAENGVRQSIDDDGEAVTADSSLDFDDIHARVDGPAITLFIIGLLMAIGSTVVVAVELGSDYFDDRLFPLLLGGSAVGPVLMIGAWSMRSLRSLGLAKTTAVFAMLPVTPVYPVSVPLGIWAIRVLNRSDVRTAFVIRARERRLKSESRAQSLSGLPDEVRAEIDGPAIASIVIGALMAAGHVAALVAYANSGMHEPGWLLFGVVTGILMFVGGFMMRSLRSTGGALMGAIAALIPVSPGSVFTIPIGIIAIQVLNRPHIRRAFVQKMTENRDQAGHGDGFSAGIFIWWIVCIFVFVILPVVIALRLAL